MQAEADQEQRRIEHAPPLPEFEAYRRALRAVAAIPALTTQGSSEEHLLQAGFVTGESLLGAVSQVAALETLPVLREVVVQAGVREALAPLPSSALYQSFAREMFQLDPDGGFLESVLGGDAVHALRVSLGVAAGSAH